MLSALFPAILQLRDTRRQWAVDEVRRAPRYKHSADFSTSVAIELQWWADKMIKYRSDEYGVRPGVLNRFQRNQPIRNSVHEKFRKL
jgi:hypothetical protein